MNKFSKVAGYRINVKISVVFLYTNNKLSESEIEKITPLKIIRHIEINATKEVKTCTLETIRH